MANEEVWGEGVIVLRVDQNRLDREVATSLRASVVKAEATVALSAGVASAGAAASAASADASAAISEAATTASGISSVRTELEKVPASGARAKKVLGEVDDELRRIIGRSPAAQRGLALVETGFEGTAAAGSKAGIGVAAAAAGIVGGALVAQKSITSFRRLADEVQGFADASGLAAEDASRAVAVADDFGISASTLARSIALLSRQTAEGDQSLNRLGVQVARNNDGNLDALGTLVNLADAYAATNDNAQRQVLIQEALGRGGRELIPILREGGDALREMLADVPQVQIIDEEELRRNVEFKLAVDSLTDSIKDLFTAFGEDLTTLAGFISGIGDATTAVNNFFESVDSSVLGAIGEAISIVGPLWGTYRRLVGDAGDEQVDTALAAERLANALRAEAEALEEAAKEAERLLDIEKQREEGLGRQVDAQIAAIEARFAVESSADRVEDAEKRVADATEALANRHTEAARAARDQARAIRDAESAAREAAETTARAAFELAEAGKAVAESRGRDARDTDRLREAESAHTSALEDEQRARERLEDARTAESTLRTEVELREDLARAESALREALFEQAKTRADAVVAEREANGVTQTARDRQEAFRTELEKTAATLQGPMREALTGYADDLGTVLDRLTSWLSGTGLADLAAALNPAAFLPFVPTGQQADLTASRPVAGVAMPAPDIAIGGTPLTYPSGGLGGRTTINNVYNEKVDPVENAYEQAWTFRNRGVF